MGSESGAEPFEEAPEGIPGITAGVVLADRYEIVRLLGQGGMGAVYEATHRAIRKRVAVKLLRPEVASAPSIVQRFLQEARTANDVRHKHIVEILDFGVDQQRPYLVMEYLEGEPLSNWLERHRPAPIGPLLALLLPVGRALGYAHQRGFVHRDVKPDNVFLTRMPGETALIPKVLDFGIAKNTLDPDVRLTSTHASMGTPLYMAPEQAGGAKNVTPAADQYAFAAMVYEALTGRPPHLEESYNALIVAKVTRDPESLLASRPELAQELDAVVLRGLARDPSRRYDSIETFCAELERFAANAGPSASIEPAPPSLHTPSAIGANPTASSGTPSSVGLDQTLASSPALAPSTTLEGVVRDAVSVEKTQASAPDVREAEPQRPTRKGPAAIVALVAVALVGVVVVAATRAPSRPTTDAPSSATTDAAAIVARSARFTFEFEPSSAEITLDGRPLGTGTASAELPVDDREHTLRVHAEGHVDYRERFIARQNTRISQALVAIPVAVAAVAAAPDAGPSTTVAARPTGRPRTPPNPRGRLGFDSTNPLLSAPPR
jgi:serine/threonine protein kinase